MSDTGIQALPVRNAHRAVGELLVPPLLFLAAAMMGAGLTAISLGPLRTLQIPYPRAMEYAHVIIPGACMVLWLATIRWWPRLGAITTIVLCFTLIGRIPAYAEHRISRLPVRRWLESAELKQLELNTGFKVSEQGTRDGTFVLVAPQHEQQAHAELATLGLLPSGSPAAE